MAEFFNSCINWPEQNRETIVLCVVGPRSILPKSVTAETFVTNGFSTFFIDELKLNVPLDQGIFVCSLNYCPINPKEGEGWRCGIHEPISSFIKRFKQRRNRYTVRICRPSDFTGKCEKASEVPQNKPTSSTQTSRQSRYETRQKRLHEQNSLQHNSPTPQPETSSKRQRLNKSPALVSQAAPTVVVKQEMSQNEDDEPRRLEVEDNPIEDIQSAAAGHFDNFSNAYMLRVKHEIDELKNGNLWEKSVEKAPLACNFLESLFKEDTDEEDE